MEFDVVASVDVFTERKRGRRSYKEFIGLYNKYNKYNKYKQIDLCNENVDDIEISKVRLSYINVFWNSLANHSYCVTKAAAIAHR